MVDCTTRTDPEVFTSAYNDNWLKDYVEALFQQQWGRNLSKYDGVQMLGGVTLMVVRSLRMQVNSKKTWKRQSARSTNFPMDLIANMCILIQIRQIAYSQIIHLL